MRTLQEGVRRIDSVLADQSRRTQETKSEFHFGSSVTSSFAMLTSVTSNWDPFCFKVTYLIDRVPKIIFFLRNPWFTCPLGSGPYHSADGVKHPVQPVTMVQFQYHYP